jgi:ABC-type amino acid transport substrate-binding protein
MEVNAGTADFAVVDVQLANSMCGKGDYSNLTVVEALSSSEEYYAVGFKKDSELTAEVNKALETLAANGTLATIAAKYGVENAVVTDFSNQK